MEIAVPSLSLEGFITDIRKTCDLLLAHYFASDFSQSNCFMGEISSLSYQVQQYGSDPDRLKSDIEVKLTRYLERHFDSAFVSVTINAGTSGTPNRYNIDVDATVVKGEQRYSVGHLLETLNGKMVSIIQKFQKGD